MAAGGAGPAYSGIAGVGRGAPGVCGAEDGGSRVVLWPLGALLACPCASRDRQALREAAIVTAAGLAAAAGALLLWIVLAWLAGYRHTWAILSGGRTVDSFMHHEDLFGLGFALCRWVLLANFLPAFPLDGATLAVCAMRYLDVPEDAVAVYYQTANAVASGLLAALAMSGRSVL